MPFLVLVALCVGVIALLRASDLRAKLRDAEASIRRLDGQLDALREELRGGRPRAERPVEAPRPASAVPASAAAADKPAPQAPVVKPSPAPAPAPPTPPISATPPAPPIAATPPSPPARPRPSPPAPLAPPAFARGTPGASASASGASAGKLAPTAAVSRPAIDWENLVGVKLFSWLAAIALALGAIFFVGVAVRSGWLQPPVRMAIGITVGLALLAGCELRVARKYPITANALDASGLVILFSTFFASAVLWHLVGIGAAFLCLTLVTAVAVLLAVRRDSLFIAILGLLGGFLTPALLSTGRDNPIGLFGYLLLLNAGIAWVAYTKRWRLLTAASLVLTTIYQWMWVLTFLTEAKLPIAAAIFLVFPILHFTADALGRRASDRGVDPLFRLTANVSGVLPLLFALYLAETPAFGAHPLVLFGFLFCLDVVLLVASAGGLLHLVGGAATIVVFLAYLAGLSYDAAPWFPGILGAIAVFVLLYLFGGAALEGRPRGASSRRMAPYAGATLLVAFSVLFAIEPATASPALSFAVLFVLLAAASGTALLRRAGAVHFIAAFFALAAQAVWSARFLTDARLLPALVVYLVFALFYIGVPILARRLNRPLEPQGAGVVILIVSVALLFFPAGVLGTDAALWGLALLLAILNIAVFVEGMSARRPVLSFLSTLMSWLVIVAWWTRATSASLTGPGLLVVAAFVLLTLGGHLWNARHADRDRELAQNGVFLGLVGHLFVLFVAAQPGLSIPPWPMFGVLAVLDIAIGLSALYARQAALHVAAIGASGLVLLAWLSHATVQPWPAIAIVAAAILALLAVTWMWLARGVKGDPFDSRGDGALAQGREFVLRIDAGAALAFGLALVVAMFASGAGAPGLAFLTIAHVVLLAGLLALVSFRRWHPLAPAAVVPCALAVALWNTLHPHPAFWPSLLVFAGGIYAVFLLYPLLLGRRAGHAIEPYLGTVLASALFFFAARSSLIEGGFGGIIGVLPVTQALLTAVVLVHLLRLEKPGARTSGRLALVAGTALAFVTVAIPLQLEKEWITIAWALEGAALVWLYGRVPHRGLLAAAVGLLGAVFVRLALNPAVLVYQPRGPYRLWNWYLYTYLVCAAAMFAAGLLFRRTNDSLSAAPGMPRARSLSAAAGTILLFLLVNIEIADFYSIGPSITFNLGGTLAQDMTYTLGWGVFAVGLLVAGIVARSRGARFGAIALLVVTVIKGFLHDLARLGGLYRVASFVGLAICLALVAIALQKFVLREPGAVRET